MVLVTIRNLAGDVQHQDLKPSIAIDELRASLASGDFQEVYVTVQFPQTEFAMCRVDACYPPLISLGAPSSRRLGYGWFESQADVEGTLPLGSGSPRQPRGA